MRPARPVLVLAALLACAAVAPAAAAARKLPKPADQVLNIGHRGASGLAPEHTIPAYDLALRLGADYIEQDLQLTKDKVLVVLHDETLDRTARGPAANCTGRVDQKTLRQIKTCDVGSWFNAAFPALAKPAYVGLRIPTLRQVFRLYGKKANFYIETKSPETADRMEERLLRLMKAFKLRKSAATHWKVLIQSFSPASLQKVHTLDRRLPLIQLYAAGLTSAALQAQLAEVRKYAVGIGPFYASVDAPLTAAAHARCLDVHPYTVNDAPLMSSLITAGVDGMFTNFPHRLNAVLGVNAVPGKLAAKRAAQARRACLRAAKRG